jgi:hypothetical protein
MSTPYRDPPERESPRGDPNELEERLASYAAPGIPALTLAIAILVGFIQGPASAILVLAGGALLGVIAVFWASVRTLLGETPLSGADAYAIAAPRSEEEQKRAILRALKDLEFERSVGKISEEDYQELTARYRGEAKRLLRLLDEEAAPRRERVEAIVAKRLRREGLTGAGTGPKAGASNADKADEDRADEAEPAIDKAEEGKAASKKGASKKSAKAKTIAEEPAAEEPAADGSTNEKLDAEEGAP